MGITYFFYRDNSMALGIGLGLVWCTVIIRIIDKRKKVLPKPNYYIENPLVYKYFRWIMPIIIGLCFVKSMYSYFFGGEPFDLTIGIFFPITIINLLDFERRIYLYESGIVRYREILEFNNIKAFKWEEEIAPWDEKDSNNLSISYKDEKYNIDIPDSKKSHVDEILNKMLKNEEH